MRSTCLVLALPILAGAALCGCEDPVPLIPRGAWSIQFQNTGAACDIQTHPAAVGTVESEGKLELKADASDGAEVSCEVKAAGGGYAVSGKVQFKGQYLSINVGELKKDATFEAPATGSVEFQTGQTAELYRGSGCIVYLTENQIVDKGKVWGSFQCELVTGPGDSECAIQQGYFAFENCVGSSTGEEEEEE
jgi:hypothetical protein